MTQHTETPWEWSTGDPDKQIPRIYSKTSGAIADSIAKSPEQRRVNAAFIVNACNAYDGIISTMKRIAAIPLPKEPDYRTLDIHDAIGIIFVARELLKKVRD